MRQGMLGWLCLVALLWSGAQAQTPPGVQLAGIYEYQEDPTEYWISEKLDGVRAYWNGRRMLSRSGRELPVPAGFTDGFPDQALDGELWLGRGRFEQMAALSLRNDGSLEEWRQVRYMVFDLPDEELPFGQRLQHLRRLLQASPSPYLKAVEQFRVADRDELRARLKQTVAAGGEGLMLHHQDAAYRSGRNRNLLKLKLYMDAEARVIKHLPGRGRLQGLMGALLVENAAGLRFRLGTGFSDAQRRNPPPVGSTVTYRYRGLTRHGRPRFASFLRLRQAQ